MYFEKILSTKIWATTRVCSIVHTYTDKPCAKSYSDTCDDIVKLYFFK